MRLRLGSIDEVQLLTCLEHGLWGSNRLRLTSWKQGDYLAISVDKKFAALARVISSPFESDLMFWDNDLFPHRISISFTNIIKPEYRPPISGEIRAILVKLWGPCYGWGIQNKQIIESPEADIIVKAITSCPNALKEYQDNLSLYLNKAKKYRKSASLI